MVTILAAAAVVVRRLLLFVLLKGVGCLRGDDGLRGGGGGGDVVDVFDVAVDGGSPTVSCRCQARQMTISQTAGAEFDERSGQDTCLGAEPGRKAKKAVPRTWIYSIAPIDLSPTWPGPSGTPGPHRLTGSCCRLSGTCP